MAGICEAQDTTCPNIYLGSGRFGPSPRSAQLANDAITLSSYTVTQSTTVFGQLRVNNHGTDNTPNSHVELYWVDSSTFATLPSRLIGEWDTTVAGATASGVETPFVTNWSYVFPTVGHYCLLVRVENNSPPSGAACIQQGYDVSSPATDPQSALHELDVIAPPPAPLLRE